MLPESKVFLEGLNGMINMVEISFSKVEVLHMTSNKVALITGCTSGIGKAFSIKIA